MTAPEEPKAAPARVDERASDRGRVNQAVESHAGKEPSGEEPRSPFELIARTDPFFFVVVGLIAAGAACLFLTRHPVLGALTGGAVLGLLTFRSWVHSAVVAIIALTALSPTVELAKALFHSGLFYSAGSLQILGSLIILGWRVFLLVTLVSRRKYYSA